MMHYLRKGVSIFLSACLNLVYINSLHLEMLYSLMWISKEKQKAGTRLHLAKEYIYALGNYEVMMNIEQRTK